MWILAIYLFIIANISKPKKARAETRSNQRAVKIDLGDQVILNKEMSAHMYTYLFVIVNKSGIL